MDDVLNDRWARIIAFFTDLWSRMRAPEAAPEPRKALGTVIDYPTPPRRTAPD